jgi:glycosyltransferase involved in cell wall biosynthesis
MTPAPLKIALLSYRSKPHSGGQGVYVRQLSRELTRLGHHVHVFSGQPLPELDEGVQLTAVASLDLYREPDPFRTPKASEYTSWIDVLEWLMMCTGAFPEPLTFSLRARRHLRRTGEHFDVVHDNQGLGWGLLGLHRRGSPPVLATIHHPITVDRDLELAAAPTWKRRLSLRRWYAFVRMQARVARRLDRLTTVSTASRDAIVAAFRVRPERIRVIGVGVDETTFTPPPAGQTRVPGRIVTVTSADVALKGLEDLLGAVAKLRVEHQLELTVVGSPKRGGPAERAVERLSLHDTVRFRSGLPTSELAALMASAQVVVVPSHYEGFSLPAVEAMACATPLVVTTGGALPEVTGPDGLAALHVPPGDPEALAAAIARLLGDDDLRDRLGTAGRQRVLDEFTWRRTAQRTADWYAEAVEKC